MRIGTRKSALARTQTGWVRERLIAANPQLAPETVEIVPIVTSGDKIKDRALAPIGGKGLFTKELEERLLAGDIDLAVHSMKDMPVELPAGLVLVGVPERADPRDALVALKAGEIGALPERARVGTASLRRQAQLLALRPDLEITLLRGNVETRLGKVEDGTLDATLLACAGLARLGIERDYITPLSVETMLPAPGQGALALECRADDGETQALLAGLADKEATACVTAERAALAALGGDCRTPLGAHARAEKGVIHLAVELLAPSGDPRHRVAVSGSFDRPRELGAEAGRRLKAEAGSDLLNLLKRSL